MSNLPNKLKIALGTLGLPGLVAALIGAAGGIGAYTFGYGQGASYLSKDPNACANCHVMREPLETWTKSSHHAVATCNDCHLSPHPIGKWITKMDNGLFHSLAFTTGDFHEPIQIKPRNRRVTQRACVKCHEGLVHTLLPDDPTDPEETLWCASCHGDERTGTDGQAQVGGRRRGGARDRRRRGAAGHHLRPQAGSAAALLAR